MAVFISLPSAAGGKARGQVRENLSALSAAKGIPVQVHPRSEHLASLAERVLRQSVAATADDYLGITIHVGHFFPG